MGAWIETEQIVVLCILTDVAPYVGAWIETQIVAANEARKDGRTLRGCVD